MKEAFKEIRLRESSRNLIAQANEIIDLYEADRIQLTLRQLYYQFVARNWIPNSEKSYKNLGGVISDGRLAGLIDWEAIDDLGREPSIPGFYDDRAQFVDYLKKSAETGYVLDHWKGQECYVELWVEKQALSSVLKPIAQRFQVGFMMNKGYSSQTAMYDASKRFIAAAEGNPDLDDDESGHRDSKRCVLLYAGDHDPSGEDMVRDIDDRLRMFGADVEVIKIALTMAQIEQHGCPPNPTKTTDARAKAYIEKFGHESWEVDALDPKEMRRVAERAIKKHLDVDAYNAIIEQEKTETAELTRKLAKL